MRITMKYLVFLFLINSASAQVLYDNPDNPNGGGTCGQACLAATYPEIDAQSFTLASAASLTTMNIVVMDFPFASHATDSWNWYIYADSNGLPSASLYSGFASSTPGQADSFSSTPIGCPSQCLTQESIAVNTQTLAAGTYFFGMESIGHEWLPEAWQQGANGGGIGINQDYLNPGVWQPLPIIADGGLSLTVIGTPSAGAPEMDPSGAAGALTLLAGLMAVWRRT